jgi:hypothetical protein
MAAECPIGRTPRLATSLSGHRLDLRDPAMDEIGDSRERRRQGAKAKLAMDPT